MDHMVGERPGQLPESRLSCLPEGTGSRYISLRKHRFVQRLFDVKQNCTAASAITIVFAYRQQMPGAPFKPWFLSHPCNKCRVPHSGPGSRHTMQQTLGTPFEPWSSSHHATNAGLPMQALVLVTPCSKTLGAPFKPYFGLSGIMALDVPLPVRPLNRP